MSVTADGNPRFDDLLAVDPSVSTHMVGVTLRFTDAPEFKSEVEVQNTFDGGATWSGQLLASPPGSYALWDPRVAIGPNGTEVYVVAAQVEALDGAGADSMGPGSVVVYRSQDSARSWSDPQTIFDNPNFGLADRVEMPRVAVDTSAGQRAGRIYVVWHHKTESASVPALAWSDDGTTWQPSASADSGFEWTQTGIEDWSGVTVEVGPDGTVHIASWAADGGSVVYGRSTDGGSTVAWGVLTTATNIGGSWSVPDVSKENPQLVFAETPTVALAVGPEGRLAIAWTSAATGEGEPPLQVLVAQSTDNGVAWASGQGLAGGSSGLLPLLYEPVGVGSLPKPKGFDLPRSSGDYYFMPQLAIDANGDLGCLAYHYASEATPPMDAYLWVSVAGGGGAFDLAAPVLDQAFDPTVSPVEAFNEPYLLFFGNSIGLGAAHGCFFPFWSDTRTGVAQLYASQMCVKDVPIPGPVRIEERISIIVEMLPKFVAYAMEQTGLSQTEVLRLMFEGKLYVVIPHVGPVPVREAALAAGQAIGALSDLASGDLRDAMAQLSGELIRLGRDDSPVR